MEVLGELAESEDHNARRYEIRFFGFVLGGSVIIEAVYSWPGLGLLTYQAIADLDYPIIQGIFLIYSAAVIVFNLAADMTYGYLDPRIREA